MSEGSSDSKMDAFSCSVAMISRRVPQHMSEVLQESIRRRLQPNHERSQESAIKCIKSRAQHKQLGTRINDRLQIRHI
jgi:hypothetical protein